MYTMNVYKSFISNSFQIMYEDYKKEKKIIVRPTDTDTHVISTTIIKNRPLIETIEIITPEENSSTKILEITPSEQSKAIETPSLPSAQSAQNVTLIVVNEQTTRRLTESGQIRYFCPQCNVRYVKFKYLKTHLKDCGNEFKCDKCPSTFKQRRTFVLHMKEKHGTIVKIETTSQANVEGNSKSTIKAETKVESSFGAFE
uniref:CSON004611 protein n=1 Tax=Culicoides sonorensis TaxID=179676 RepID=A0A336MVA9_CULSO